ncbi:MAG: hypothetical protein ACRDQI_13370 [Pseudonocardiaceae bacterium]
MHEDSQGATNPPKKTERLRREKDQDRPRQRGAAIERRTAFPAAVLVGDVEKRENYELAAGRRTVSVKGTGGITATVVVTLQRGTVWLSIHPPFTWDAIMGPEKVDELIRTLVPAREAALRYRP